MKGIKGLISSFTDIFTKNLIFLIVASSFSEFGNVIYSTAISFWILDITKSAFLMGYISFISIVPRLILSPIIGVYVDRNNKKNILIFMDILRGISMCLFGIIVLFGIDNILFIILNSVILSLSNCFYQTSLNASIVHIFKDGKFIESNSISTALSDIFEIVGAVSAGFLITIFYAPILFILNGITFFISAFTFLFINIPHENKVKTKVNLVSEFKETIKLCINNKALMYFIITKCILGFLLQIDIILVIPLFKSMYNEIIYGFGNSFKIIGTIISGFALILIKKYFSNNKIVMYSLITLMLVFVFMSNVDINIYIVVTMFILGFAFNIYTIITDSEIIMNVPEEHRAKSLAIIFQIVFFFISLGSLVGGFLGDNIGIMPTISINSIIIILVSIAIYYYRKAKEIA